MTGLFPGFFRVWYNPESLMNTFSMNVNENSYRDSATGQRTDETVNHKKEQLKDTRKATYAEVVKDTRKATYAEVVARLYLIL